MVELKSTKFATVEKILRLAKAARNNNPRVLGPMASPPTVTSDGATQTITSARAFLYATYPTLFNIAGGLPVFVSGTYRIYSAVISATGGNLGTNDGKTASSSRIGFETDAPKVSFRVHRTTAAYRFLVDEGRGLQYVTIAGQVTTNTGGGTTHDYISLTFATRAKRKIFIELQTSCGLAGVYVGPLDTVTAISASDSIRAIGLGDSYMFGTSATALGDNFMRVIGDMLGWSDTWCSGSGGTGWATDVSTFNFLQRITDLTGNSPDIGILMGSYNDRALSTALVQANCLAGIQAFRAALQTKPLIVLGAFAGSAGPSAGILGAEAAVAAAVAAANDPLTVHIPISNRAGASALIFGTGKVGATNNSGNADVYVNTDGIHLETVGHEFAGKVLANDIEAALSAMLAA